MNNGYPGAGRQAQGRPGRWPARSPSTSSSQFVSEYTLDKAHEALRRAQGQARSAGQGLRRPEDQGHSFWTMGFNQHTRGTWVNNMIYNVHLLVGKISEPGNSPFSLTGQPSACGTAREVGTFAHRLPADMVVTNPKHRELSEKLWKLPPAPSPTGSATTPWRRAACSRTASSTSTGPRPPTTCRPGRTSTTRSTRAGAIRRLHRGVRRLPDRVGAVGRPDPALGDVGRRKAPSATPSAAPSSGASRSRRRARPSPTCGSTSSSPSASRPKRCGRPSCSTRSPSTRARRCTTCSTPTAR
jgi:hypothetical protein